MAVQKGLRDALKVSSWFFRKKSGSGQMGILDQKMICHDVSSVSTYGSNPGILLIIAVWKGLKCRSKLKR